MTLACAKCGQKNRVPLSRLSEGGKCGKCSAPLPRVAKPLSVNPAQFDEIVRTAKVPVLVDFWAEWCGPCRMAAPELKKLAKSEAGNALILKVDTEKHPELAARYQIRGIPNFLVFRAGELIKQQAGLVPASEMAAWLR